MAIKQTKTQEKRDIALAIEQFKNDCQGKMFQMVDAGKRNWDRPDLLTDNEILVDLLKDVVDALNGDRHHLNDIANRAMILWWRKFRMPAEGDRL